MNLKGVMSEGYVGIIVIIVAMAFLGILLATMMNGLSQAHPDVNANTTRINNYNTYDRTNSTLAELKEKFIDEDGNARTGTSDILNALYTGVGGFVVVMFNSPSMFFGWLTEIAISTGIVSSAESLVNVAIFFIIAVILIAAFYAVTRR